MGRVEGRDTVVLHVGTKPEIEELEEKFLEEEASDEEGGSEGNGSKKKPGDEGEEADINGKEMIVHCTCT